MSQKFEIRLKKIEVIQNGVYKKGIKASNIFEALLIQPNTKVSVLSTINKFRLSDNREFFEEREFELEYPSDATEKEKNNIKKNFNFDLLKQQMLFKQEFEGDSYMEVNISLAEEDSKIEEIIYKTFGIAFKVAFGTIPGFGSIVKELSSPAVDSIFSVSINDKKKIESIGKGILIIDDNITEGDKEIDLIIPKKVEIRPIRKYEFTDDYRRVKIVEVGLPKILRKGQKNGYINLEIKKI